MYKGIYKVKEYLLLIRGKTFEKVSPPKTPLQNFLIKVHFVFNVNFFIIILFFIVSEKNKISFVCKRDFGLKSFEEFERETFSKVPLSKE